MLFSCVTFAGIASRFWRLDKPDAVVFDEFHFGKFVNHYFTGAKHVHVCAVCLLQGML